MRPLAYPIFRWLLLASLLSEIGTWIQFVGAEWLITSQTLDPLQVSLLAAANTLPIFLLGLPAGILADMFGRRKILLTAQFWMVGIALLTVFLMQIKAIGPWTMILLSFCLYSGLTLQEPAMHAVYPELVPRQDLPAAIALHVGEVNIARFIGPALAGTMIRVLGLGSAFIANLLSFAGLIWFLWIWQAGRKAEPRAEAVGPAFKSAFNYVRSSSELQLILVFAGLHAFLSVAPIVALPIMARTTLHLASDGYGVLLSCFGLGSILGAMLAGPALSAFAAPRVLGTGLLLASLSIFALSKASRPVEVGILLLTSGIGIAIGTTSALALAQSRLADWARGRVMGICLMVLSGGFAAGSVAFGWLARVAGLSLAQLSASGCILLLAGFVVMSGLRMASDGETQAEPSDAIAPIAKGAVGP